MSSFPIILTLGFLCIVAGVTIFLWGARETEPGLARGVDAQFESLLRAGPLGIIGIFLLLFGFFMFF